MTANFNPNTTATAFEFSAIKFNKQDTIYQCTDQKEKISFPLTELIKIEKFQGYSKASNCTHYLRIRNESSWKKSNQITGLWRSCRKSFLFGGYRKEKVKTLIIFRFNENGERLKIYLAPFGYYPSRNSIETLINGL